MCIIMGYICGLLCTAPNTDTIMTSSNDYGN